MHITGEFHIKLDTPRGFQPHILKLQAYEDGTATGCLITPDINRETPFDEGRWTGNTFQMVGMGGNPFQGGVDGDQIAGTMAFRDQVYAFYGTRA